MNRGMGKLAVEAIFYKDTSPILEGSALTPNQSTEPDS